MKFINIGFGNMVAAERVVAVVSPDSAPIKRLIQDAKDSGRAIDVTCGKRTRAVIITDSEHVILSAFQSETISNRLSDRADDQDGEDDGEDEL
ncbi:MAG: extracellular matrix/biofilm biosynthesis regulator RemA family protein [Candidatus Flemingiibacterium sp.]